MKIVVEEDRWGVFLLSLEQFSRLEISIPKLRRIDLYFVHSAIVLCENQCLKTSH